MRLSEKVYITTPASIESELKTDLVAPEYTSFSEFYQHKQEPQEQNFQLTPFFFNGHLIPVVVEHHDESTEQSDEEVDDGNTYKVYRPSAHENPQFIDMTPPPENQDEPNYYATKPRKTKKYSKAMEESKLKKIVKKDVKEVEEEKPEQRSEESQQSEEQEEDQEQRDDDFVEESAPASRLDFQLHGKET